MASDVDRIAGMLADRIHNHYGVTSSAANAQRLGIELAEQLSASGIGHVPTALHQAADEVRDNIPPGWSTTAWREGYADAHSDIEDRLRARADRAGGEA